MAQLHKLTVQPPTLAVPMQRLMTQLLMVPMPRTPLPPRPNPKNKLYTAVHANALVPVMHPESHNGNGVDYINRIRNLLQTTDPLYSGLLPAA